MVKIPVCLNNMTDAKHLVQIAEGCDKDVDLMCGKYLVDAKSMLGVFSLPQFDNVEMCVDDTEKDKVYEKLEQMNLLRLEERQVIIMCLVSQEMRKLAPELDPLRIGTGWKKEDLGKVQVMVESTYGDSHPGSGHLNILVEEVRKGVAEEGGFGARYYCTDICDGESQGTDGINYSLASREMIANMIEIHANATPFDAGVYRSSCDKGVPGNLMGLA